MELLWTVLVAALLPQCFPDSAPVLVEIWLTGQDLELECQTEVSEGAEVLVLEWTREDLDRHVLLYRDDKVRHENQHPRYRNRVELRDQDLRSGNLTILMKNISSEDGGLYKCEALIQTSEGRKNHQQTFHLRPVKPTVAQSGEDHLLPCESPPGGATLVELLWTREGSDAPVLRFRDGAVNKHPAFSNRVQLSDPQLRSGNTSIVLKNISTDDSGVYTCHMTLSSDGQKKNSSQFIRLTVKPGTKPSVRGADHITNAVLGVLGVVVLVGIAVSVIVWCRPKQSQTHASQASDARGEHEPLSASGSNEDRREEPEEEAPSAVAPLRPRSFILANRTVRYSVLSRSGSDESVLMEPPAQPAHEQEMITEDHRERSGLQSEHCEGNQTSF